MRLVLSKNVAPKMPRSFRAHKLLVKIRWRLSLNPTSPVSALMLKELRSSLVSCA